MAIVLVPGTKETIRVPVVDVTGNTPNLDAATPTYSVYTDDAAETEVITDHAATNDGMTILCLIDTTGMSEGDYKLFVKFTEFPDIPILGPVKFRVDA